MAKTRLTKTIHYKRAEAILNGGTFQEYLDAAFTKKKKPNERIEVLIKESGLQRLFNSVRIQDSMTFGQMIMYEAGKDQTVVIIDDNTDEFPLESIPLPKRKDGKAQEVLQSVLYFGALENHLLLMQSQALNSRAFEAHANWFLQTCAKVLPKKSSLCFSDKPTDEARKKIEKSSVKKVLLGCPLKSTQDGEGVEVSGTKQQKIKFKPAGLGFDVLAAALGENWLKDLDLDESLDEANLRVNLEISYFRKTTERAHTVLDNIATAMRHAEPEDVRVDLDGGGRIVGEEIKMSGPITIDAYNGVPDSSDVYKQMYNWLKEKIIDGSVK